MPLLSRRRLAKAGFLGVTAPSLLSACRGPQWFDQVKIDVDYPGMAQGHELRAKMAAQTTRLSVENVERCEVLIVGSGIAGLSAAWQLRRQGVKDVVMLAGPELHGNSAGTTMRRGLSPTGAHYLPLPSVESRHIREILQDMQVYDGPLDALQPSYDESVVVHAPSERLLQNGQWRDGLIPQTATSTRNEQVERFLNFIQRTSATVGADGRRVFVVPIALASIDPVWRALDTKSFKTWLEEQQYTDGQLLWYLKYCCADEFGASLERVSAWAGLHYFCSRGGHAKNAEDGAVLTWPDGLASITTFLQSKSFANGGLLPLSAFKLQRETNAVVVFASSTQTGAVRAFRADRVILATPHYISARLDPELVASFAELARPHSDLLPAYHPWLVSNFQMRHQPTELPGTSLSWDNVLYNSESLGYVNASHQLIRVNQNAAPILTAYHAFANTDPLESRQWCQAATQEQLVELASADLRSAYGERIWQDVEQLRITVRGHGMACPSPNFLSAKLNQHLQTNTSRVRYAHSDLSGYSVAEEASWWGIQAALP